MSDDKIPTLEDVIRPGNGHAANGSTDREQGNTLSDAEIEAIAKRVMERYSQALEKSLTRAIKRALDRKNGGSKD